MGNKKTVVKLSFSVLFFESYKMYHETLSFSLLEGSCDTALLTMDIFTHHEWKTDVVIEMFI